jgi:hypothetical protein
MATGLIYTAQPDAPHAGATGRATYRKRAERAIRRRAGRIWGLLLVLALLLPLLVTSLLGGH